MTLREKVADWLTGGKLTRLEQDRSEWRELAITSLPVRAEADRMRNRLAYIAHETASVSNGTGRKINRMAREALGKE